MIIPIASDHAGFEAKELAKKALEKLGHEPVDYGTHESDSVDYPDFAKLVATAITDGEYERGILICGSGQGMCMTANKFPRVRAALAWSPEIAALSAQHNNANVLCLPGRFLNEAEISRIVEAWITAEFEGGRHQTRVDKIAPPPSE
ncbi:MAG: ribose 5-phosphate isomerase B [Candidatus Cyclonatronum sp.]|uniref:ribose 5-phosphate isomerase B n=1 Tax=Cyclonatronum sp. TaxID=3024185 RepID=UPI0025BC16DE|nr:ribose 5-phosphate isomerase B [Cyclonatronum sp.]MCC5934883.1 ribose 5-phosphate isomerase B [Balneolales bacterium]MCH8487146.1 ribose 5-phosphate isomerase B [Cyclonatronum sp.]